MPDDSVGDPGSSIDNRHLLLIGAGPGLGMAVARRFADGGYRVTLVARSTDGLSALADRLADTGAQIDTIAADASDPEGLGARMAELYNEQGAPGLIIYNAVMGAPDNLLSSRVEDLQTAYAVDVISAIVVTQVAAPAMRAAGSGTIIVTGGGFADHPIPALATISLGKAALRSAATMLGADLEPDGIRVAILTIAGQIVAGTAFDTENIATLLGGRPFRRSLAGGVSLYRRIGLKLEKARPPANGRKVRTGAGSYWRSWVTIDSRHLLRPEFAFHQASCPRRTLGP
jgi:short-subunit dehydrogenase